MTQKNSGIRNIARRFFLSATKYAEMPALGFSGDDAFLTYKQLARKVMECAISLGRLDVGETVGLLSENRPEWGKAYLAILTSGGIVVPIDSLLKEDELRQVFEESKITKILVSHRFIEIVERVNELMNSKIVIIDLESIPTCNTDDFVPNYAQNRNDAAVLIFTSGTTGNSKKVILTHENILSDIDSIIVRLQMRKGDRFLSVLPLHHTFEATCGFLTPLLCGGAVYYVRDLNSREIMTGFKKHHITHFVAVPLIYEKLYHGIINAVKKAPRLKRILFAVSKKAAQAVYAATNKSIGEKLFASLKEKAGLGSMKLMVSGGAALPIEIGRGFNLLGFPLIEGYGLTETSPVLTANPISKNKIGSVGLPLDNVEIRIDSPDKNGIGEILAKGPMITPGYQDNPKATKELIRNGWLYTGDLGYIDKDGYLYIKGRAKNLIVSAAGKNIYPEEIEAELVNSPYILEAMVYGHTADNGREEVAARIVPDLDYFTEKLEKGEEDISDEEVEALLDPEIRKICTGLADFKRVKHIVYNRQELEKTSTRKIKRYLY